MRRLFLRIYVALGMVLMLGIALAAVLGQPTQPTTWAQHLATFATFPETATREIAAVPPNEDRGPVLESLSKNFGGHDIRLMPRIAAEATLSARDKARLARGETVALVRAEEAKILVPLAAEPFVIAFGPVPSPPTGVSAAAFAILFGLLVLSVTVYLLIRPLDRQLEVLSEAAEQLGEGHLEARADVSEHAAMYGLAASFNEMAARIQSLIASHRELLHGISHELRGPLQRVNFAVELLEHARDNDARTRQIRDIQADIGEVDALVDELLSWSRLEGGSATVELAPTDPSELITRIAGDAGRLRTEVEVTCNVPDLPTITLDRRLFSRAVTNLASNAVRYANGRVAVSAAIQGGDFVVRVEDDGPGIPEADRERIFEPFVRLDYARSRDKGGIGLGLAISQRIAGQHGGRLSAHKADLGGAALEWRSPIGARGARDTA